MQFRASKVIFYAIFVALSIFVILFVLIPLLRLITLPSPSFLIKALTDKSTILSISNSLIYSFVTAIIALFIGIPMAFLMAKGAFGRFEKLVETLVDLPLAVPHTVAGIALLFIIGRKGVVGAFFYNHFGIKFTGTGIAIVTAMLFVSMPYLIDSTREGFKNVGTDIERASFILGASHFSTFRYIFLPLSKRHIETGFLLTWARAISEFGAVVILAYYPMTAPVKIYDAFTQYNLSVSVAVAAVLLTICLTIFLVLRWVINRDSTA
jgi:molybdate/tungstate transport system permease protein